VSLAFQECRTKHTDWTRTKTDWRPFNSLFSRTTWTTGTRKVKLPDFGVAVESAAPYANHLHLTPDR